MESLVSRSSLFPASIVGKSAQLRKPYVEEGSRVEPENHPEDQGREQLHEQTLWWALDAGQDQPVALCLHQLGTGTHSQPRHSRMAELKEMSEGDGEQPGLLLHPLETPILEPSRHIIKG